MSKKTKTPPPPKKNQKKTIQARTLRVLRKQNKTRNNLILFTQPSHTKQKNTATGGKDALVGDHVGMENIATTDLAGLVSVVANVSVFDEMFIS